MAHTFSKVALSALIAGLTPLQASAFTLTPSIQRGEQTLQLSEPGATTAICIIPRHFSREIYSRKDLEKEQELCGLNRGRNAAVCPKTSSTNPGLEFYEVPAGQNASQIESQNCFAQEPGAARGENLYKKAAKYKYSTSCSYTPSILGYYHISRILGGAGDVPVAVMRTFDLQEHIRIGRRALTLVRPGATIHTTWTSFLNIVNNRANSQKKDQLFTDALDQSYGALSDNPSGEEKYGDVFYNGGANQVARYTNFKARNALYQQVSSSSAVSAIVGRQFNAANMEKMQQLKDMSDMIVLDTLLSQEDRLGNLHYRTTFAYLDQNDRNARGLPRLKYERTKNAAKIAELRAKGAVEIKKMLMKDNDCGVSRQNHSRDFRLIERVAHMSPLTYQRLLMMNSQVDQPAVVSQFRSGMMFTTADYTKMKGNLSYLVSTLQSRCRSGALKLDLDAEAHFAGQAHQQNCELQ